MLGILVDALRADSQRQVSLAVSRLSARGLSPRVLNPFPASVCRSAPVLKRAWFSLLALLVCAPLSAATLLAIVSERNA